MYVAKNWYRFVSMWVCLSLLVQTLGLGALTPLPASAAPAAPLHGNVAANAASIQRTLRIGWLVQSFGACREDLAPVLGDADRMFELS